MPRIQALADVETSLEVQGDVLTALTKDMPKFLEMTEALDHHGCSVNDIAKTVSGIMNYGDSSTARLAAARLAAELRGEAKGKNSNTINFIISDSNGVNLMNMFNPAR